MSKSVFISYSRQEVPFVDLLLDELEDRDIQIWLDYRSLVPGKPWLEQIISGIDTADVMLLVVSKASINSKNVELEYQHALEKGKRVILLLFQAMTLPPELQACEWVDFRRSFRKGVKTLVNQLDLPVKQEVVPQKGFRASFTVWCAFFLSILAIIASIPGWWTLFIPALLIPLPIHILKRNYQYYRVRFALIMLPIVLGLSMIFFDSYKFMYFPLLYCMLASWLISPLLLFILSRKGMRAWGNPAASIPRPGKRYRPEVKRPEPVPFFIEHAPEDKKYADAVIKRLTYYDHAQVMDVEQAKASFVIISRYKDNISIDPQKHAVYPVIIQDVPVEDPNLQRIQWIDFRSGLKNMDNLARLLSQPDKLLKALGVVPISQQVIYPRIIQVLDYYLILLGFFTFSFWIPLSLEFNKQLLRLSDLIPFVIANIIFTALILRSIYLSRRALITREGKGASLGRLIGSLFWVGFINLIQTIYLLHAVMSATLLTGITLDNDMRGSVTMFLPASFILGFILVFFMGLFHWGDLTRWFPSRQRK